ncbi:hypothetical protein [Streptomyces sp. ISL-11]|uniref:hypothetical protein n=1 Tax=Streptomyces sp. ISL-11 TaxID=2819174 RepID=UPI001BEBE4DF|nr:hypothetical protein [Streptomyces sp. ISL-11]MBT2382090.1 hypothetical protein [Streptomyces sp. ISL-11]
MTALRHHLYRRLHPRRYRAGQLAEQRHQLYDPPVPADGPRAVDGHLDPAATPVGIRPVTVPLAGRRVRAKGAL